MIPIIKQNKDWVRRFKSRNRLDYADIEKTVEGIIRGVRLGGDEALRQYSLLFDGIAPDPFKVAPDLLDKALETSDPTLIDDLIRAHANIKTYHEKQMPAAFEYQPSDDIVIGQLVKPIEVVGMYVPGGTAAYPSTVLMNAVPAKIAGVEKLIMITPPDKNGLVKPALLAAAKIAGVDDIYTVGGAQGIAALAYGTESIPKVDKIVGPGNMYVALAKKQVSGLVGIDMVAGPSEILIVADETARADWVAADLISQAEHDVLSSAILVTTSKRLAQNVQTELDKQVAVLPRASITRTALQTHGALIVTDTLEEAIEIADAVAPEHLELMVENPFDVLQRIKHAGAVFIGPYTPEPVGDYMAGPNHTLPTSGTARFSSALSTTDFIKKTSYVQYGRQALYEVKNSIVRLAEEEGLVGHAKAVSIRFDKEDA